MTNTTTMMVVGILPFCFLALASLNRSFRAVLKAVFSKGDTSEGEPASEDDVQSAKGQRTNRVALARQKRLISRLTSERARTQRIRDDLSKERLIIEAVLAKAVAELSVDAVAEVSRSHGEVVIRVLGSDSAAASDKPRPSHAGKHSRGDLLTEGQG
ncbi:hypothetical protein ACFVGV_06265 [Pseudarthrobacter scleromae]|uniref:hypothetical protein n=1 Tax=Pseudarthrobacter scleromae TaxID=158897 RepID=UPI003632342D